MHSLYFVDADISNLSKTIISNAADYIVEILQHEIQKNHDQEDLVLPKLIAIITDMRTHKDLQIEALRNYVMDNVEMGLPEELLDVFT